MSSSSFRELVRLYGVDPKKSLGQNFLVDEQYLGAILAAAELEQSDVVLEIGPGLGTLTRALADVCHHVVAVELDERLIDLLRVGFATRADISVVHGDILALDPPSVVIAHQPATEPAVHYKVVANLPYYITSPVLRHLLEAVPAPSRIVVMVQREVAERICAQPGDLSILAVSVQFYAEPRLVHHVPAAAFYPRPQVDSVLLRLDVRSEPYISNIHPDLFFRIVRAGFGQKRKQLLNSLSNGLHLPKPAIVDALNDADIDPKRRAQTLSLDEWGALALRLASTTP